MATSPELSRRVAWAMQSRYYRDEMTPEEQRRLVKDVEAGKLSPASERHVRAAEGELSRGRN